MTFEKKDGAAVWKKQDKNGNTYVSICVTSGGQETWYNCFPNNKTNDKQPDFRSAPPRNVDHSTPIPSVKEQARAGIMPKQPESMDNSDVSF